MVGRGHLKCTPSVLSILCKLLSTTGFFALAVYLCTNAQSIILSRPLENWKAVENVLQYKVRLKDVKLQDYPHLFILRHLSCLCRTTRWSYFCCTGAVKWTISDHILLHFTVHYHLTNSKPHTSALWILLSALWSEITCKPLLFCWHDVTAWSVKEFPVCDTNMQQYASERRH